PAPRLFARPFPRRRRRPDPLPPARLAPLADLARLAPLPLHVVLPLRAGRGPLRRDPARDAPARRMGGAVSARRTVPRQAAAAVLAGDAQLPRLRRPRLGCAPGARTGGPCVRAGDVPPGPAEPGRTGRVPRGAGVDADAGLARRRPPLDDGRPLDAVGDAGPVVRLRGGADTGAAA